MFLTLRNNFFTFKLEVFTSLQLGNKGDRDLTYDLIEYLEYIVQRLYKNICRFELEGNLY